MTKLNQLIILLLFVSLTKTNAQYIETMDLNGLRINMQEDYSLVDDNANTNQKDKIIAAIEYLSNQGGGIVYIPKGVYKFSLINLRSNVHILIEEGTIIKPDVDEKVVFTMDPIHSSTKTDKDFIENVSVRGDGGAFTIDYHEHFYETRQRAVIAKMVKNFLIQDMIVKDNFSVYCGITLAPSDEKELDVSNWEVSRATNGTVKNITHYNASPGYGLVQCHGAQSVLFENLYSKGGVTFRLEVGANNKNVGVYDLEAKNIINENGRAAVMLGPHSAKNGIIKVDGVVSISSTYAVTVGNGGVKEGAPDQTPGYFHEDSSIDNIVATYGKLAQVKGPTLLDYPNIEAYFEYMKVFSDNKFYEAPSVSAVYYGPDNYSIQLGSTITMNGFPYYNDHPVIYPVNKRNTSWGNEKTSWKEAHPGDEFVSDKGVSNNDYSAIAYDFNSSDEVVVEPAPTNDVQIYPNPATDYVNINTSSEELLNRLVNIVFINDMGKIVLKKRQVDLSNGPVEINISKFNKGIYIFKWNGKTATTKGEKTIIVQ